MKRHMMYLCFLLVFLCSPAAAGEMDNVIKVSGTGVVSVKPDRARLRMQVSQVDQSIVSAKKTVDDRVSQVQKMLLDLEVKPADINTSVLSVYEERNELINRDGSRDITRQSGYRVTREITVTVENLSKLDVILDKALNLGTNTVQSIEFYSSRVNEIKLEAMQKASQDAGRKAEFLAKQFGCKVGKAQQIEYEYRSKEPQPFMLGSVRESAPSFLQGTLDVTATVNVIYQIE